MIAQVQPVVAKTHLKRTNLARYGVAALRRSGIIHR